MASIASYIGNVGKSISYSTIDRLKKDIAPNMTEFFEDNNDTLKSMYSAIKNMDQSMKSVSAIIMDSKYTKTAIKAKEYAWEDIKTGKFYNKERIDRLEQNAANAMMGDFGFDDDFDMDSDSGSFEEDEMSTNDMIDSVGEKTSKAISTTILKSAEYTVEANREIAMAQSKQNKMMFGIMTKNMSAMNSNIGSIMEFNNKIMTVHIDNSKKFYEHQTATLNSIDATLKQILENQNKLNTTTASSKSSNKITRSSVMGVGGMPNLSEYYKAITKNIKGMSSGAGEIAEMFGDPAMLESLVASPMKFVTDMIGGVLIPNTIKKTTKSLDNTLSGAFSTAMNRLSKKGGILNRIFGISSKMDDSKLDTGKYHKGPMQYNGMANKAIVEVMPMYLSKILAAVSGEEETRYDYKTGKLVKASKIKKIAKDMKQSASDSANMQLKLLMGMMSREINFNDDKEQKEFDKNMKQLLNNMFESGNDDIFKGVKSKSKASDYKLSGKYAEDHLQLMKVMMENIRQTNSTTIKTWNKDRDMAMDRYNEEYLTLADDGSITLHLHNKSISKKAQDSAKFVREFQKGMGTSTKSKSPSSSSKSKSTKEIDLDDYNDYDLRLVDNLADKLNNQVKLTSKEKSNLARIKKDSQLNKLLKQKTANKSSGGKRNVLEMLDHDTAKKSFSKYAGMMEDDIGADRDLLDDALNEVFTRGYMKETTYAKIHSIRNLLMSPVDRASNMIANADKKVFDLLFGDEDENGLSELKEKGLFKYFADKAVLAMADFGEKLDTAVIDPLKKKMSEWELGDKIAKVFGMDSWSDLKGKVKGWFKGDAKDGGRNFIGRAKDQFSKMFGWGKDTVKGAYHDASRFMSQDVDAFDRWERYKAAEAGIGSVSSSSSVINMGPIGSAAKGLKRVSKTGVIAVSEGEMIVPPDMNPYNISKRYRNENKAIDKFNKFTGNKGYIPAYAAGGVADPEGWTDRIDLLIRKVNSNKPLNNKDKELFHQVQQDSGLKKLYNKRKRDILNRGRKTLIGEVLNRGEALLKDGKEAFASKKEKGKSLFDEMFSDEKVKEDGKKLAKLTGETIKEYAPETAVNALVGAGIFGLVGMPLVGAAVGAGAGIIKNNTQIQETLFGTKDENGEFSGGIINKNISNYINKYAPGLAKGGLIGGIAGALTLGPIPGLLIGSAASIATKNEKIREKLFGEGDVKLKAFQEKLKKIAPSAAIGLGAVALGPFGMVGNVILGSALGFATGSDEFKKKLFGDPIKKQVGLMAEWLKNGIKSVFEKNIGAPLGKWFKDKILKSWVGKLGSKVWGGAKGLVKGIAGLPMRGINAINDHLRGEHILKGNADYMSASERVAFGDSHKSKGFIRKLTTKDGRYFNAFDNKLASMSDEDVESLRSQMKGLQNTRDLNISNDKLAVKNFNKIIGGKNTNYDQNKEIVKISNRIVKLKKAGKTDAAAIEHSRLNKMIQSLDVDKNAKVEMENAVKSFIDSRVAKESGRKTAQAEANKQLKGLQSKFGGAFKFKNMDKITKLLDKEASYRQGFGSTSDTSTVDGDGVEISPETAPIVVEQKRTNEFAEKIYNFISGKEPAPKGTKSTTVDANGNIIETIADGKGGSTINTEDKDTVDAIDQTEDEDEVDTEYKKAMTKMPGLFGGIGNLFGKNKKDDDEEGNWFTKLLSGVGGLFSGLTSLIPIVGAVAAAFTLLPPLLDSLPDIVSGLLDPEKSDAEDKNNMQDVNDGSLAGFGSATAVSATQNVSDFIKTYTDGKGNFITDTIMGGAGLVGGITYDVTQNLGATHDANMDKWYEQMGLEGLSDVQDGTYTGDKLITTGLSSSVWGRKSIMDLVGDGLKVPGNIGKWMANTNIPGIKSLGKGIRFASLPTTIAGNTLQLPSKILDEELIKQGANKIGTKGMEVLDKVTDSNAVKTITKVAEGIKKAINKLLDNSIIKKSLETSFGLKSSISNTKLSKMVSEFTEKIIESATKKLAKSGSEMGIRAAINSIPVAGPVTGIVKVVVELGVAVWDFTQGYNNAATTLGIKEEDCKFSYKFVCGLLEAGFGLACGAISAATGGVATSAILAAVEVLFPLRECIRLLADGLADLLKSLGIDVDFASLDDLQEEASSDLEAYNKENGTDLTMEEFNTKSYQEIMKNSFPGSTYTTGNTSTTVNKNTYSTNSTYGANTTSSQHEGVSTYLTGGYGSGLNTQQGRSSDNGTFISQVDPKYAGERFNTSSDTVKQTIGSAGCAPASAAMVINQANRSQYSMEQAAQSALKYKEPDGGVNASYFGDIFKQNGLNPEYYTDTNKSNKIADRLQSGQSVVLMGADQHNTSKSSSPYGPNPHYIVATGMSEDGKYITVNDPEAKTPGKKYSASKILGNTSMGVAGVGASGSGLYHKFRKYVGMSTIDLNNPDQVAQAVWGYFKSKGFSDACVAGIIGNMSTESGLNPASHQTGGTARGLCQWEGGRQTSMKNYCESTGTHWENNLNAQLDYVYAELTGQGPAASYASSYEVSRWNKAASTFNNWVKTGINWQHKTITDTDRSLKDYSVPDGGFDTFKNATDIKLATAMFCGIFERPGAPHIEKRLNAANKYYSQFSGKDISSVAGAIPGFNAINGETAESTSQSQSAMDKFLNVFTNTIPEMWGLKAKSDDTSGTSGTTGSTGISSGGPASTQQQAVVDAMNSIEGTVSYSMSGPRNPDKGSADCSSTVEWAYRKALGDNSISFGSTTLGMLNDNENLVEIDTGDGDTNTSTKPDESKLQLGDVLLFSRPTSGFTKGRPKRVGHVEIYKGNGQQIGHGSGMGPKTKPLQDKFISAKRYKGFMQAGSTYNPGGVTSMYNDDRGGSSGGFGSGLAGSGSGLLSGSTADSIYNSYSNKSAAPTTKTTSSYIPTTSNSKSPSPTTTSTGSITITAKKYSSTSEILMAMLEYIQAIAMNTSVIQTISALCEAILNLDKEQAKINGVTNQEVAAAMQTGLDAQRQSLINALNTSIQGSNMTETNNPLSSLISKVNRLAVE